MAEFEIRCFGGQIRGRGLIFDLSRSCLLEENKFDDGSQKFEEFPHFEVRSSSWHSTNNLILIKSALILINEENPPPED